MHVVAEQRPAVPRIKARAHQMRYAGRYMCIHENHPFIIDKRIDQLRHQLPDKDGIRAPTEHGQSVIFGGQRLLRQVPTQAINDVESDTVVLPFQVSVAND